MLDRKLDALISDFNAKADQVRLLFIVGPTCDVCKKGLKEMKDVVLNEQSADQNLSIFVVHIPALDAKRGDIEATFSLFDDRRATHYWDEHGTSGIRFQRTLGLPNYAWDVWMIYPPEEKWVNKDAPPPSRWWHQLDGVSMENHLDPLEFSKVLNEALISASTQRAGL